MDIKNLIKNIVINYTTPAESSHGQAVLVNCPASGYRTRMTNVKRWYTSLCGPICDSVNDTVHGFPFSSGRTDQRPLRESPILKSEG